LAQNKKGTTSNARVTILASLSFVQHGSLCEASDGGESPVQPVW